MFLHRCKKAKVPLHPAGVIAADVAPNHLGQGIIDYDTYPCEWAEAIGEKGEYISALYLLNDDYTILVIVPTTAAPAAILQEVEE